MGSYWIESTKNIEKDFLKLNNNLEVDVCIIGAGITGVMTAYYLANEGKKIAILVKQIQIFLMACI